MQLSRDLDFVSDMIYFSEISIYTDGTSRLSACSEGVSVVSLAALLDRWFSIIRHSWSPSLALLKLSFLIKFFNHFLVNKNESAKF